MHLFIKDSIFHNFWPNFGPRFWAIFSISGNSFMNHCFSIISCEKTKNGSVRLSESDATFHRFHFSNYTFETNFRKCRFFRYFLNFGHWKCAYESLLQHRNILRKNEKRFCEVFRIRCTFSLNIQFFIIFGLTIGNRFWDIFSISGNALMNHFFSIVISCEKTKNGSVRFCGSDAPFH